MPSHESGFFESPFARTCSLLHNHSTAPRAIIGRTTSQLLSHKAATPASSPGHRPSHTSGAALKLNASLSTKCKRGMSFHHKRKASKSSGTILRAVPASTACATAPLLSKERDIPPSNQEIHSSVGRISPASDGMSVQSHSQNNAGRTTRLRSSSATALSPIKAGKEMKSFSSTPSLKGTIGIYKHGRIQWEHKDTSSSDCQSRKSSQSRSSSSARSQRPRIQVVIPKEQRDRPLPTSPFFGQPSSNHIRSASADIETMSDISPPSGSKRAHVRDSMVSPLSTRQARPPQHFHPSINEQISKSGMGSPEPSNATCNSSDDSRGDDASSTYSNQSSLTSAEAGSPPCPSKSMSSRVNIAGVEFSVTSPVKAGVFSSPPREATKSDIAGHETGHRYATPSPPPRHYAHHPRIEDDTEFIPTCSLQPPRNASSALRRRPSTVRRHSNRCSRRRSLATNPGMGAINQAINRSSSKQFTPRIPSPTLSEAENDLEAQLTSFTDDNPFKWDTVVTRKDSPLSPQGEPRKDSITYDIARYSPPPELPRKSSKRQSQFGPNGFRLSRVPGDHIASQIKRNRSLNKGKGLSIIIPETKRMTTDDFVLSPIPIPPKDVKRTITPEVAENVILTILRNLESLDDLFATAVVNRGFYRVFKRHELELMKAALRKMSPPAWEHREICYPGHDEGDEEDDRPRQEYTPASYIQYYTRDMYIIAAIKSLIKDNCQSFIRPEISIALVSEDQVESARVDDALWRIWTFCKIFGCGKGREEDVVAQMDWLNGGALVHQSSCTYSVLTCDDFNETLASAPECFAKGNEGGLTAEQLFDMMELWNCLGVLLQPIGGRTIQAREFGVYENTDVRGGDIDGEEIMLGG